MSSFLNNFPLAAALISIVLAQFVKVPLYWITHRQWRPALGFGTGGMPSSHSAGVAAVTAAIGLSDGWNSSVFAVAFVLSAITMYDAAGIRRHAGTHAIFLNRLIRSSAEWQANEQDRSEFKELLGHRPVEVMAGAAFGVAVSFILYYVFVS